MLTRWGRNLDPDHPLPEHPRPQLVRDTEWASLNGPWDYAVSATPEQPDAWDGRIVVPFSPETVLSGVERQVRPDEWLWYRRSFAAATTTGRVLLHFGAVDQSCTVWVNGTEVGRHTGGYLPFSLDVTAALAERNEVVVRVRDLSETGPHARGKQRLDRGTIWYTAQSGIWQTVWLEAVPDAWIERITVVPDLGLGLLHVTAHTNDGVRHEQVERPARRWTLDDPHLHRFDVTVGQDTVHTYAALREIGVADGAISLNGEAFPHVGVLDQGYWPDGLLTPPSDEAMVFDLETVKSLGFNAIRKHAKVEPLRWYHHCDRLGILVWQDMVNGGGRYRDLTTQRPARHWVWLPDSAYSLFGREDAAARDEFVHEVRRTVELLQASPSVVVWTLFNEGWGQFHSRALASRVKRWDPTRLVNAVSGWIDQRAGDVRSFHSYLRTFRLPRGRRGRRVRALTEYGGYSLRVEGHDWSSREYGYQHFEDAPSVADGFADLHRTQVEPALQAGLAATFYTQLSDVEDELNGLLTWDREVLKVPAATGRRVVARLFSAAGSAGGSASRGVDPL